MTPVIRPLRPLFAGEVSGVDLRVPLAPATAADASPGGSQAAVLEMAVEK